MPVRRPPPGERATSSGPPHTLPGMKTPGGALERVSGRGIPCWERLRHSRWQGAASSALVSRSRAMPVGDRRSKPSPRFSTIGGTRFRSPPGRGAGQFSRWGREHRRSLTGGTTAPAEDAPSDNHRGMWRVAASPAAGGRSQVGLLTFFRFLLLLVLVLGRPRAIQLDRHPAEEFA